MSATPQTSVPDGTWTGDNVHSTLSFEVPYAVNTFKGEVPDFNVTLADGVLSGSARIESLKLKEEHLQGHLQSPEFFDAERHPELTFTSTAIRRNGDSIEIDGDLTIKGITVAATLKGTITGPAVDHFGATRVGLELRTVVDRTTFDMNWNMPLPSGEPALSNDVTLTADLSLVQQA